MRDNNERTQLNTSDYLFWQLQNKPNIYLVLFNLNLCFLTKMGNVYNTYRKRHSETSHRYTRNFNLPMKQLVRILFLIQNRTGNLLKFALYLSRTEYKIRLNTTHLLTDNHHHYSFSILTFISVIDNSVTIPSKNPLCTTTESNPTVTTSSFLHLFIYNFCLHCTEDYLTYNSFSLSLLSF